LGCSTTRKKCEDYEKEGRVTTHLENGFRECFEAGKDRQERCAGSVGNYREKKNACALKLRFGTSYFI